MTKIGNYLEELSHFLTRLTSDDGTVRQCYARLADLIKVACQRAPRNLTRAEWAQFIKDEPYRATCENLPVGK